ncbi:Holliday junction resolvase RecU [Floricoccus tropicus]|uniref:Holliday junction resolvase RecU n=1 Tax=Floricoccus tropicus TaxID=1859473 RepID=A0A1E8GQD9_9LACT|nr:Holliday junction resolvase RecU [Floricoccus tropicus]OFI50449.1 Holliday junction resolvase RecU [Floricoccus tropicus]
MKYPNGIRKSTPFKKEDSKNKKINFANRGMSFESEINATNEYYLSHGIAVIHKKPTPIQIVKVDYPRRSRAKIVEAYFKQASTTDFSGVYKGRYIDFEAKETNQLTTFPMKNFHEHQIRHMENVRNQNGISFVLFHFSKLKETYYLDSIYLISYYDSTDGKKSIPLSYIREHGYLIEMNQIPRIPYLKIINNLYLGGHHNE